MDNLFLLYITGLLVYYIIIVYLISKIINVIKTGSWRRWIFLRIFFNEENNKEEYECSVCGAIVPAEAKKCLNCDSEFEEEEKEKRSLKEVIIQHKIKFKKILPFSFAAIFIIFYIMPYISNTLYRIITNLNTIFAIMNYPFTIVITAISSEYINLYTYPLLYFTGGIIIWYLIGKFIDKNIKKIPRKIRRHRK